MSYRAFKRVLGETSLERKCRFLFGACLLVLISGSFFWYGQQTEKLVNEQDRTKGSLLVDTIMIVKHWPVWAADKQYADYLPFLGTNLQGQQYTWDFLKANAADLNSPSMDLADRRILEEFMAEPVVENLPADDPRGFRQVELPDL